MEKNLQNYPIFHSAEEMFAHWETEKMIKYKPQYAHSFKRNFKKLNEKDKQLVKSIVFQLEKGKTLPAKNRDHALKGNKKLARMSHQKAICFSFLTKFKTIFCC